MRMRGVREGVREDERCKGGCEDERCKGGCEQG